MGEINNTVMRLFCIIMLSFLGYGMPLQAEETSDNPSDREYWVETMDRIARPVIWNLATETLHKNMPAESVALRKGGERISKLEAFGRTLCGISHWIELGPDNTKEGILRGEYAEMTRRALSNAVNPESPEMMVFDASISRQPLVDAAFLCQGLLHAPVQLWEMSDDKTKANLINALKTVSQIEPWDNNWLLFSSMVEAALWEFAGECNQEYLMRGVKKFMTEWYKGDSIYGDGSDVHVDYYNSFVIHPMLTDVLKVMVKHNVEGAKEWLDLQTKREQRYAVILERMISPEGTFPVVGRSIGYRFGAFHALSHASYLGLLPDYLPAAQVRSALTAVIKRQLSVDGNFDENGWLTVGFAGHQVKMTETYINTGSLYLCCSVFVPLGLPASDPFWSGPAMEWTNLKAWGGQTVPIDKALKK